jgi:hypothetical protein
MLTGHLKNECHFDAANNRSFRENAEEKETKWLRNVLETIFTSNNSNKLPRDAVLLAVQIILLITLYNKDLAHQAIIRLLLRPKESPHYALIAVKALHCMLQPNASFVQCAQKAHGTEEWNAFLKQLCNAAMDRLYDIVSYCQQTVGVSQLGKNETWRSVPNPPKNVIELDQSIRTDVLSQLLELDGQEVGSLRRSSTSNDVLDLAGSPRRLSEQDIAASSDIQNLSLQDLNLQTNSAQEIASQVVQKWRNTIGLPKETRKPRQANEDTFESFRRGRILPDGHDETVILFRVSQVKK